MDKHASCAALVVLLVPLVGCCTVRNYSQICNNCKVSTTCADNFRTQTLDIESCSDECLAMEVDQCNMGVASGYAHTGYTCKLYQVCTEVEFGMLSTSIRRTCSEDCLQFQVTKNYNNMGACATILEVTGQTEASCLSLCLDTTGCRGATYSATSQNCTMHDCNTGQFNGGTVFLNTHCEVLRTTTVETTTPTTTITTTTFPNSTPPTMSQVPNTTILPFLTSTPQTMSQVPNTTILPLAMDPTEPPESFFDNPANIAIISTVGGVAAITGITTAVCKAGTILGSGTTRTEHEEEITEHEQETI